MSTLVLYLQTVVEQNIPWRNTLAVLTGRFALSFDGARLVMDRFLGGIVRAETGNPANEPDRVKDPVAWTSYRLALGLALPADEVVHPSLEERSAAEAVLQQVRHSEPTPGTANVGIALEVVRLAVEAADPVPTRVRLLVEAATSLSAAAESCKERLGKGRYARPGSQEWVDGVQLAAAARVVTAAFAALPDPDLEAEGTYLHGRIVTSLLGSCHAFVGPVMLDRARTLLQQGDPDEAVSFAEAVLVDFEVLLDRFAADDPFDEHVIALECLLDAVELIIEVRGSSAETESLRERTVQILGRSKMS